MRVPFIAANWKMYKTVSEAVVFAKELRAAVKDVADVEVVIGPPFTAIHAVAEALRNSNVGVTAQDMYWEREGAFTGEVSAAMIKEAGAEYVIIGHSERRRLFGETDAFVNRKLVAALAAELCPIVCIGETLEERDADATLAVIERQIETAFASVRSDQIAGCVVAYEPVWAIGTGRTATPGQAEEVHHAIRRQLVGRASATTAERVRILYGGSVKPDNIDALMAEPDIDGALVGGASLDATSFARIVQYR
jgi:triosephosphate isomerase